MSIESLKPTIWAAGILSNLEKSHVYGSSLVVNRDYEGIITNLGSSVKINRIGDISVSDYDGTDIEMSDLNTTAVTLTVDNAKYFNFAIDDVDAGALGAAATRELTLAASKKAAYALRDASDAAIAAAMKAAAGVSVDPTTVDAAEELYNLLVDCKVQLDSVNVPNAGRFAVLPAAAAGYLLKDNRFVLDGVSTTARDSGQVFTAAGFTLLTSNNVPPTIVDGDAHATVLFGTADATSFVEQIVKVVEYSPEKRFSKAVKGLHVYGVKVVRPECLGKVAVLFA